MGATSPNNNNEKPLLVHLDGVLYDISEFASKHPGGIKVLQKVSGTEIGRFMRGEERIMGVKHEHSQSAYEMLRKYDVSREHEKDPILSSNRGVLRQVGSLGVDYWKWIHQPYEGTLRLFDSDLLERCTRTAWYIIPSVWIPIVILFTIISLSHLNASMGLFSGGIVWATSFFVGVLTWTLTEYLLHRFVFHWEPSPHSPSQLVLHFLLHGIHHKTPMDGDRLVFPPVPAVPIVGFFYLIYSNTLPWPIFCAFGSGKLFGYVMYDCIHYYLHHGSPRPTTHLHFQKVYHHNHHFKDYDVAFGISTTLWDHFFSTVGMGPL
ncbi:hypothetical protein PENTCL1PPCAC_22957 [Pristionchus entomophagus]|uniref:Fatty acid 2-hydroxylase n=1 Tax=Pristionchus entomophagus TaxID=358040 RepID=A0AAV5U2G8_9BILA|nr:hypothetical protein PENTCL1PPCAC_22957 [Pristionchus entomophagus]